MKSFVIYLSVIALFSLEAAVPAQAADNENSLRSRIYHKGDGKFLKDDCTWKSAQIVQEGQDLLEIFPLARIRAIEIEGDEVTLPTALVIKILTQGRFQKNACEKSVGEVAGGGLWLANGNCLHFNVLFVPEDRSVCGVRTGIGELAVPGLPEKCKSFEPQVKPGMTRAEIEKTSTPDGGISVPFRSERYVMRDSVCGAKGEIMKVNIAFKPAGLNDEIYWHEKWAPKGQSPQDIVMRVSPRYIERPYFD